MPELDTPFTDDNLYSRYRSEVIRIIKNSVFPVLEQYLEELAEDLAEDGATEDSEYVEELLTNNRYQLTREYKKILKTLLDFPGFGE
ncbi:MAG: hypothetical protein WC444_04570 [Candidatus Paceibacterota bacterium]